VTQDRRDADDAPPARASDGRNLATSEVVEPTATATAVTVAVEPDLSGPAQAGTPDSEAGAAAGAQPDPARAGSALRLATVGAMSPDAAPAAPGEPVLAPGDAAAARDGAPLAADGGDRRRVGDRRAASTPAIAIASEDDGWPLEVGQDTALQPPAAAPQPPQMPSPAAAAYEAARIVGEMVGDIESAPGAALMAAAAAGAAIEVARARVAAGEPDRSLASSVSAADAMSTDPVVTARMQRDRILRALAEDVAATATTNATAESAAASAAPGTERTGSRPGSVGARTEPPRLRAEPMRAPSHGERSAPPRAEDGDDAGYDQLDPVAIAAAAIARLRERARSDLAELRGHYRRHDGLVVVAALVIILAAGRVHDALVSPPTAAFDPGGEHGLAFDHPRGWLTSRAGPLPPPRIAHDIAPPSSRPAVPPYHVELSSTSPRDPTARIEVLIDKKPAWSNIVTGLDLDRRTRWGELYALDDSSVRSVEAHQWLRTAYRFAHAPTRGDVPRIDRAVEYATIDREQIYVVTLFGTAAEIAQLETMVAPSLRVATQTGLPLVPQTGHLSKRSFPNAVSRAFGSTVMVVVADVVDGRLRARGGGSGVIVARDGSVLTNYHVIHDRNGRLHDVFVIGRFSDQDQAPQLDCAGRPSRSKLQRELDLALIKCDLDLDGRRSSPTIGGRSWPPLLHARALDVKVGQRMWVLGYPDVGGGGLTLSEGEVAGWSGVDGAAGKDFLKTDAAIRHGNSGGPVVDDQGRLVGIATAVRTRLNATGDVVEVTPAGGRVRPISAASDLLAIAAAGWTPREGQTDVELEPSAIEAPSEGIQIQTRVLDLANAAPVPEALVMVLRPGVSAGSVDVNRLDDQVLAYGRSNAQGEVQLKQPVPSPGIYTIMVVARGYEVLIAEGALTLDDRSPPVVDPWGKLSLRAR
jgi:S1-C subfamily serine protease